MTRAPTYARRSEEKAFPRTDEAMNPTRKSGRVNRNHQLPVRRINPTNNGIARNGTQVRKVTVHCRRLGTWSPPRAQCRDALRSTKRDTSLFS